MSAAPPSAIEVDLSLWPVVRIVPRGLLADDDLRFMFSSFDALWKKEQQFFAITDTRFAQNISARQRQMIGEWMKLNKAPMKKSSLGSVVIVESAIIRGALTAIGWLAQTDPPSEYLKNWEEAMASAVRSLEKHGLMTDNLRSKLKKAI